MKSIVFTFLVFSFLGSIGQTLVKGKILGDDDEPIPFVNIGIVDTHIGTISELNGDFELLVPAEYQNDTLLVSCVGFHRQSFKVEEIKEQQLIVTLKENVSQLQEIVITEKRDKPKIEKVGGVQATASRFMTDVDYAGSAIAQLVRTKFDTTFIHWISLGYSSRLKDLKMRIKFLCVGEDGEPGEVLIPKEIIVDLLPYDGFMKFNLESDFLSLTEKAFFVQFEPLILKEDRENIYQVLSWALEEHPEEVFIDERGDLIVDTNQIDMNFTKFKIFGKISDKTYFRTSSFGKWYPSEELSVKIGISDGSSPVEESLAKAGVLSMFNLSGKKKQAIKSTVTDIEADQTRSYSSLADYLKRIGTLKVTGAGDATQVYVLQADSSSLQMSNEPIFIVDHVNMGRGYAAVATSVDVNLIKNVRVLNSLIQTALYGEQGNNGVIIISTSE